MIGLYYVGEIPSGFIQVRIVDNAGVPINLEMYKTIEPIMLGARNQEIDTKDVQVVTPGTNGIFYLKFPVEYSLFTEPGEYVLQLKMTTENGEIDFTNEFTMRVRKAGGR